MFHFDLSALEPQNLAVKLTSSAESLMLKSAHPWVFSNSIQKINKQGKSGDVAILFRQNNNKVFGIGLYDPHSPIRIKMLHYYSGQKIDQLFFKSRISQAFELRKPLFNTDTNSYRLIFGENDGFPGLIVDVYNKVLVVKLYSSIWFPYLHPIIEELIQISNGETVVLRLSRNLQNQETYGLEEGQVLYGKLENELVEFLEHGIKFSAHVIHGHKTGYFLDHRNNRKKVGKLSKDKSVLDVFSYAGGFSIHALVGGASEVYSVDVSKQALEMASYNASLNEFEGKHFTVTGDAFEILNEMIENGKTFDLVVIDPPSFAKSKQEEHLAKRKYEELAELGVQLVAKNGTLVLASCSSRVSAEDFFIINEMVLENSERNYKILDKTYHDIDHPVNFKEGSYLKCGYYRFND